MFNVEWRKLIQESITKLSKEVQISEGTSRNILEKDLHLCIQRVTEISTLILTGNRTRQKEQLFYLPF
jgi:hypothetical protein